MTLGFEVFCLKSVSQNALMLPDIFWGSVAFFLVTMSLGLNFECHILSTMVTPFTFTPYFYPICNIIINQKFLFCLGVFYKLIWTANFCNDLFHLFKHKPHHKLKNYLISKNCHHFYLIYHLKMRSIMVNDLLIEQVIYLPVLLTNSWRQLEIKIN